MGIEDDKFMNREIENNFNNSLDTLMYIFEITLGNMISEIEISGNDITIKNNEIIDFEFIMSISVKTPDPDLTDIALKLKKADAFLNNILSSYHLLPDGNLSKTIQSYSHSFTSMLDDLSYDPVSNIVKVYFSVISFDF